MFLTYMITNRDASILLIFFKKKVGKSAVLGGSPHETISYNSPPLTPPQGENLPKVMHSIAKRVVVPLRGIRGRVSNV
jgi:hypothetical protein